MATAPASAGSGVDALNAPITKEPSFVEKRPLPEDPGEFDKAIKPMKVMVRPILHGISRIAKAAGTSELDQEEKESGTVAFSALLYQSGGMLDARVLVGLWVAGVTIPRILEAVEKRNEKRERAKAELAGYLPPPVPAKPSGVP